MKHRERAIPIQVYLSEGEKNVLEGKFQSSGMKSRSAFIRQLILSGYVFDVDYSYLREYNASLGRISGSMNQIAKRLNSTNNFYKEDVEELQKEVQEIWRIQRSILSRQPYQKQ